MYSSKAIANFFLDRGMDDDIEISPMKIIKLVYIAHGYHLAVTDVALIEDYVQAWAFGPVIPELYHEFKKYGNMQIERYATDIYDNIVMPNLEDKLPKSNMQLEQFLNIIWRLYKEFHALDLSEATHKEGTPWERTIKKKGLDRKYSIIDDRLIKAYYKGLLEKSGKSDGN